MVRELKGFITMAADEVNWEEDKMLNAPKGIKSKILAKDKSGNVMDVMVKQPPGYVEPRHSHNASHSIVILEGKMIIEGKTLTRGGYIYAEANVEHGPYEFPEGCTVFAHVEGPSLAHTDV